MGTNDLALGLCSEEVVTLGIMRIAEEIHHHYPNSVVVIQGILPRSNHKDGSLEGSTKYSNGAPGGQKKWFKKTDGSGSGYQRLPLLPPRQRQLHLEAMVESEMERELQYATPTSSSTDTTTSAASSTGGAATRSPTTGGGSQTLGQQAMSSSSSSAGTSGFTRTSSSSASNYANWKQQNHYNEDRSPQPGFDYYLWPSIKRINKELEDFCAKHEHLVYFDSDELLLGSIGNERYRAAHKSIIRDLMPNYVHLNSVGHKVVIDAINDELQRIIYDDDEKNDIETQKGSVRKSKTGGS